MKKMKNLLMGTAPKADAKREIYIGI